MPTKKITLSELRSIVKQMVKEENPPIRYVYSLDNQGKIDLKKMVGTHQYGKGFTPNELGVKLGFKSNPTSIPDGTKIDNGEMGGFTHMDEPEDEMSLKELHSIVKQMVKEEMVLKEDYLELKSIGKLLYSFLKRKGYDVEIKENSSKSKFRGGDHLIGQQYSNTKGGTIEIHQFSDVEEVGVFIPVYALAYQFIINPDNHKYIESLVSKNRTDVIGKNYGLSNPEKYWSHIKDFAFGKSGKIANSSDIMKDPAIQKTIGSLGVELQNLIKSKYPNMQFGFSDDDVFYAMYFREPKTAKGAVVNPNQRPNAPRPQAQQEPIAESLKLRNFFK